MRAFASIIDPLPPYKWIEGRLDAKEQRFGRHFLLVDGEIVEVDWLTFETLAEGEALKIRSTRSNQGHQHRPPGSLAPAADGTVPERRRRYRPVFPAQSLPP